MAERRARALLDPGAQTRLERTVARLERSRRQRVVLGAGPAQHQHARALVRERYHNGGQVDGDGGRGGGMGKMG